ncbi:MAG: MMPL family transporter, partial [bacterium]
VVGLYFKHLGRLVLTLIPLAVGVAWTLGVMGFFGIKFNPANIITLPLVIGIGVAYGVYIVDRYLEEGRVHLFGASTGKAVLLSALTTIFGFAVMMIGRHRGMVSLGLVMTIGISFCFITSAWILPPLLALVGSRKNRSSDKK